MLTAGFNLPDSEYQTLFSRYDDDGDGQVNYLMFCEDIDEMCSESSSPDSQNERKPALSTFSISNGYPVREKLLSSDEIDELEEKIREIVFTRRIRLSEFFSQYDSRRRGYITRSQFSSSLDAAKLSLRPEETAALCDRYVDPLDRKYNGQSYVCWVSFNQSIDSGLSSFFFRRLFSLSVEI